MNYHRYFAAAKNPVETCLVGSGSFGRSFLAQGRKVPLMRPVAKGATILCADVELDETSVLLDLRRQQEAAFFKP
jgi:predicted homoserine dehydrogenase-like protein